MRKDQDAVSASGISREKTVNTVLMDSIVFHLVSVSMKIKMSLLLCCKCALKDCFPYT